MTDEKKRKKVTLGKLRAMKRKGEPITWLTCYDYPMAQIMDASGAETRHASPDLLLIRRLPPPGSVAGIPDPAPCTAP